MNRIQKAAQLLGRASKGKTRHYSEKEKEIRRKRLAEFRKKRWPKNETP